MESKISYQEILDRFKYEDESDIKERIASTTKTNYRENRDIINEIILWKMNRMPHFGDELVDMIYSLADIDAPEKTIKSEKTKQVLVKLLQTRGMKLPMVSTVLHFYFPQVFPIIDQRAYRELYGIEYPQYVKLDVMVDIYMKYIEDTWKYQREKCPEIPYEKIDKILYQLDKEKGNKVIY